MIVWAGFVLPAAVVRSVSAVNEALCVVSAQESSKAVVSVDVR